MADYYRNNIEECEDIEERYSLMLDRIKELADENEAPESYRGYFTAVAEFILKTADVLELVKTKAIDNMSKEELAALNNDLYSDILGDNYNYSYVNYEYSYKAFGCKTEDDKTVSQMLTFLFAEIRGMIAYAFEGRIIDMTLFMELFVEVYSMIAGADAVSGIRKSLEEAIYYFEHDYAEYFVEYRIREQLDPALSFATDIIMNSDLNDLSYLYRYGEYISDNELKLAEFLNTLEDSEIEAMASTYTEGYRLGFVAAHIDLSEKKMVNIRYAVGQERMVRAAIKQFEAMGLKPVCHRYAVNRINRRSIVKIGYEAAGANRQYEFDHRMDEALFMDRRLMERKLEVLRLAYKNYEYQASTYAGPACIETFGGAPFEPVNSSYQPVLSKKQQEIGVEYTNVSSQIVNEYIPGDKRSFTIIAYPMPEIGENFPEIFHEIVKINTLDNNKYRRIHQSLIDELDKAVKVRVLGTGDNKTDMLVSMHEMKDPSKETNFENCVADVNIPVGEVFTSPKLTGTEGILNVSDVFLNDLNFKNLTMTFKDGKVDTYDCDNFEDHEAGRAYIKDNILMGRDTLPIGEFAIGTNTTAYVVANKYDIVYKLPILIVEKMGPHFAVGDTCYSHSEDTILYNPDGKEIVAKENECSVKRKTDIDNAYFNCHTDITIPYREIGAIYSIHEDGTRVPLILDGRFVLPGTEELNEPLDAADL